MGMLSREPESTPALTSEIEISDPIQKTKVKVVFHASVKPSNEGNRFDYQVISSANAKILVH
jgi:hypothetical protein